MTDHCTRRDWIKTVGVIGAAVAAPTHDATAAAPRHALLDAVRERYATGDIVELYSTSEVYTPARGDSVMRFSFDFPEPAVVFGGHRFSVLVFTDENTYAMDRTLMKATGNDSSLVLTCTGMVWAGGQEKSPGSVTVHFTRDGDAISWDISVEMPLPIWSVTTVVRDIPRGQIALGGGNPVDTKDDDVLAAYTFGGGDLHGGQVPRSITTPLAIVKAGDTDYRYLTTQDKQVRPKRFFFQCGEHGYRTECVYEHDAWRNDAKVTVPRWTLGRAATLDDAMAPHFAHLEKSFHLQPWETRPDMPAWMRDVALVITLHGMHYTGFIFNDYAQQLAILKWIATQIPPQRVLVFLSSWDGRYYWDYPNYTVPARMGGPAGFAKLISEARAMGFRMMPMFGTNAANRRQPIWSKIQEGATKKLDGERYDINWVDWNNDRHQDAWLTYMNLGEDHWRKYLEGRIAEVIDRYKVDAYFLDIVGGHVNAVNGDMHEGTRRLVTNLRERYPSVVAVGEMPYDALYEFIPMFHAGGGPRWRKYARFYQHLSAPAPGRGSSGVHEWGFSKFNTETLGLNPNAIPTLQVVDDTFAKYRDLMAAIVAKAKARAGIA